MTQTNVSPEKLEEAARSCGGTGNGPNFVKGPVKVVGPDDFGLDANHNGIGCEDDEAVIAAR